MLTAAHGVIETSRLSGEFSGAWDHDLERLFWTSRGGLIHGVQMGAMVMIVVCALGRTRLQRFLGTIGAIAAAAAFIGSGHTSIHPLRALLAPMLLIHVMVGACWFGSLAPLLIMIRGETTLRTRDVLMRFSTLAGYAVPMLGIAGLTMAVVLVAGLADLTRPYGLLLISKLVLFLGLLILASYNRWRFVPAMAAGSPQAAAALRRSIGWEIAIIAVVLAATSVMTTYFSPRA